MRLNLSKVHANVKEASTDDLLDRVTLWHEGMEPEALEIIEAELRSRGIQPADLNAHSERRRREAIVAPGGFAAVCYRCGQPAIDRRWIWGRLWRILPMFPRLVYVCAEHRPGRATPTAPPDRRPPE
jgi:ATP-dependent helicase YprA (DUF1998 family)